MWVMALTAKMEAFCQAILAGSNQSDAYRSAYNAGGMLSSTVSDEAYDLMRHPDVAPRIESLRQEIQAQRAESLAWDAEKFTKEARINLEGARNVNQWAPANGALKLIGEATGLLKEQNSSTEVTITKVTVILRPKTKSVPELEDGDDIIEGEVS